MHNVIAIGVGLLTKNTSMGIIMEAFVTPMMRTMCIFASLICIFFLINGGINYMTSSGKPENLEHAKHIIRNALLGLVIVLAATAMTSVLTHAYASTNLSPKTSLPTMPLARPKPVSNGLVDILIKAITGLLNNIIQSVAEPFLKALAFFTASTPLMASNPTVFNLWLTMVGVGDSLFVLVLALLGFHVMSAATFGFNEIEFKHLLPRVGLIFLLLNVSIFAIDGVIEASNAMVHAINTTGGAKSVWDTLTNATQQSNGQSVAALLIMVAFLILSVVLLVYYIGRIVTLYVGAVLSPLILLLWLVPGFRDFSESAGKTYLTTVFVLFVHVVILQLAASLFGGISLNNTATSNSLIAIIIGLATLIALLKTQGLMMRLSYVSTGSRNTRILSNQFLNGASYLLAKNTSFRDKAILAKDTRKLSSFNSELSNNAYTGNIKSTNKASSKGVSSKSNKPQSKPKKDHTQRAKADQL